LIERGESKKKVKKVGLKLIASENEADSLILIKGFQTFKNSLIHDLRTSN